MLVKKFSPSKNLLNQSGVAVVTVIVVSAALLGASYMMYNKLTTTSKLVNKIERKATAAYTVRGLLAYAKDLLSSRVCIDPNEHTGLALSNCKLTDSGSLERLLLTNNVFTDLCTYYRNTGKIQDGLQKYCEAGMPSLLLSNFEFDILATNISMSHPLYPLFDKQYDSALSFKDYNNNKTFFASCVKVKYSSSVSSTATSVATVKTEVQVYRDASCTGEIVSEGGTVDMFFPRALNSYSLISNRSISVGATSAESDINNLDSASSIIFMSPVLINKNFYIPTTGSSSSKKVEFQGKVFVSGEIKGLSNNYVTPVLVDSGDLWLSRYPYFSGIQGGLNRIAQEFSLTRMFDPTLAPVNDPSITAKCNDYNRRKEAASFCVDLPKIVVKKNAGNKYQFGMTKQSELQGADVKITSTADSGVQYPTGIPTKAQMVMSINTMNVYLSVQSATTEVDVDLIRLNAVQLKNGADCITLTSPDKKICINSGKVLEKTLNANPQVNTTEIPSGTDSESAEFINNDLNFERKTISNCHMNGATPPFEVCDLKRETYTVSSNVIPGPYLKILTVPKITSKGTVAPQTFDVEFYIEGMNSNYEIRTSSSVLNFLVKPFDYCASKQTNYNLKVDLDNSNVLSDISSSGWQTTTGGSLSLTTEETDYLAGDFCFFELCGSVAPPSSSYASYDADWSSEAFASFNYNPIDNKNNYIPNASKTGYTKIFDLSQSITNKIYLDNSFSGLFSSVGIVDRCIVSSSATVVKGLFICRYLVIEDRSSNLEMIGTFIVDKLKIGNIGSSKIFWKNMFHPAARNYLSNDADPQNGLSSLSNCLINPASPFWGMLVSGNRCDPSNLIQKKSKPLTWTTFDPLCIKVTGTPTSLCKPESRAYNFDVIKIYEYFGN